MANPDVGFGTTITFQSGFFAQILSVTWGGIKRSTIETSHMGSTSGYRTFLPGDLKDPGEITVKVLHDPDDNILTALTAAAETVTVTYPVPAGGATGATWAASGFMTDYDAVSIQLDERMEADVKIKLTGVPTFTDGT